MMRHKRIFIWIGLMVIIFYIGGLLLGVLFSLKYEDKSPILKPFMENIISKNIFENNYEEILKSAGCNKLFQSEQMKRDKEVYKTFETYITQCQYKTGDIITIYISKKMKILSTLTYHTYCNKKNNSNNIYCTTSNIIKLPSH